MSHDVINSLEATREGYSEEGTWLRFLVDAYQGAGGFRGRVRQACAGYWGAAAEAYSGFSIIRLLGGSVAGEGDTYLDRHPREESTEFQRRVNVSHYLNYVRPTTNLKVSYVVSKPHTRLGLPDELKDWIERTGYDKDFRRRALSVAVLGFLPVLVDKPSAPVGATTAAQAGTLEPYVVQMLPCSLLDYEVDERGKLTWAKTVTKFTRKAWNGEATKVSRYTIWTRDQFEVYVVEEVNGAKSVVSEGVKNHDFGAVPMVSWRAETSIEDPVKADSINSDIALEARRLFNLVSELDDHIRSQVFAILAIPKRDDAPVVLGTNQGLVFDPEAKHVPLYIAPPASVAATLEKRIEASIVEIYRMARVEYERASGVRSSAQSKEQNFQQTNLAIADFAQSLANADRETLILVGRGLGVDQARLDKIVCQAHESYETAELNDEIDAVVQTLTLAVGLTAKVELLKRLVSRELPGLSAEQRAAIESEIKEAAEQADANAELMAKAERDALSDPNTEDDTGNEPGNEGDDDEE